MMSASSPTWTIHNNGRNDSIEVTLPPGNSIQCSNSSIVSYDKDELQVRLQENLRRGKKSFFATNVGATMEPIMMVENTAITADRIGSILLSPKQLPCAIAMHLLENNKAEKALRIARNAYLASDAAIHLESANNDSKEGEELVTIRASVSNEGGGGYVALAGLGDVHKHVLQTSETKAIEIGRLMAYTDSIQYSLIKDDDKHSMQGRRHDNYYQQHPKPKYCQLQGPGVAYVQTHAPYDSMRNGGGSVNSSFFEYHRRPVRASACRALAKLILIVCFCFTLEIFGQAVHIVMLRRRHEDEQRKASAYRGKLALGSRPSDADYNNDNNNNNNNQQDPWQEEEL